MPHRNSILENKSFSSLISLSVKRRLFVHTDVSPCKKFTEAIGRQLIRYAQPRPSLGS